MKTRFLIIIVFALVPFVFPNADARGTLEEYCNYSVENQLPTPWDYRCYDDPFGNPQREMNLESNAINDDYRNCGVKDTMKCFEYSQEICRPSYFHHYQNTGEGDSIYFSVFLKEDCTIHVIVDNRRDMYSSIEDRRLYQTVCPDIELRDDHIILDSCKELEPFNGSYESFRIGIEKSESKPEIIDPCEPDMYGNFYCYEEEDGQKINLQNAIKYFGNTERVGEQYFGGGAIDMDPDLSPSYAYDFANGMLYRTILPLASLIIGISGLFLVPYFILKKKNISSRPYLALILAGLLLFFTIPNFISSLGILQYFITQPEQFRPTVFGQIFLSIGIPIIVLIIAGIILFKSSVIRKLIKKRK